MDRKCGTFILWIWIFLVTILPLVSDTDSSLFVPTDATPYSSSTPTASPTPTAATSRDTGAIAGGAVAAVILLGMICGMLLYFRRKKKRLSQGVRSLTFKSQYSDRADDEDELQELPSAKGLRVEGSGKEAATKIFDS